MDKGTNDIVTRLSKKSALLRGMILNEVILLERIMDIYLAKYFCENPNKQYDLMRLVFSTIRISYENKRQILQYLLEQEFKDKYKTLFKKSMDDMKRIGEIRNKVAHHLLDTTDDGLASASERVAFLNMTHEIVPFAFTNKGSKEFLHTIIECRDELMGLIEAKFGTVHVHHDV